MSKGKLTLIDGRRRRKGDLIVYIVVGPLVVSPFVMDLLPSFPSASR
jgi:hypothetical protein